MTPAEAKKKAKAAFKRERERQNTYITEGVNHLFWDTSMTLQELHFHVEDWIRKFGGDAVIDFDVEHDYSDSSPNFYIKKQELESDADYEARMLYVDQREELMIKALIETDKKQTDSDLKEFERLKKKLEKKGLIQ